MIIKISDHIKQTINNYNEQDSIILNNNSIKIDKNHFQPIFPAKGKTITFIDGGQAEILITGNFCLSLIRVAAVTLRDQKKLNQTVQEFYLFTTAICNGGELNYQSKIFTEQEPLIDELDLLISSNDPTIKTGLERAPIHKITSMARRLAELALAAIANSEFTILDGTLEQTFLNEEKYLAKLTAKVSAVAKTSSLYTLSGNSPAVILNKLSPPGIWCYPVTTTTSVIKLHPTSKHVFRFEGNVEVLPYLIEQSKDALFLGYPYGLIIADKLARIPNQEKKSLIMQFMLRSENKIISEYLQNTNAHEILDSLQY